MEEPPVNVGQGIISGMFEEEIEEETDGRLEVQRRVAGAGVSVSRKTKQGRTEEDEFILVDYVYTDNNGEFSINELVYPF